MQVGARDTRVKSPFTCGPVLSGGVARVRALLPLSESLAPPRAARGRGRVWHTRCISKRSTAIYKSYQRASGLSGLRVYSENFDVASEGLTLTSLSLSILAAPTSDCRRSMPPRTTILLPPYRPCSGPSS